MTGIGPFPTASAPDLGCLQDAELTGVLVWKYGVTLRFNDQPLTLTVESNAEFHTQGRVEVFQQEVIVAFGARVLALLGCTIVAFNVSSDKTLTLNFSDGSGVTLRPDATGFESYSVNFPDGTMFIG